MPPIPSSPPPTFVPGLWGSLSAEERERIEKSDAIPAEDKDRIASYVNHHADQFLPELKIEDLNKASAKRVQKAVDGGMDLDAAIRTEAGRRFGARFDSTEDAIGAAIEKVKDSDPVLATQLAASKERLASAVTLEEKTSALFEASHLLKSVPGATVNLNVAALTEDEQSQPGMMRVGQMGRLYSTAHAIDQAGNGDGKVETAEIETYFAQLESKVDSADELIAQRQKVLEVGQQLEAEDMAGTIANLADSVIRENGDGQGGGGALIGNGDGKLSLGEVNAFIKEMTRRGDGDSQQLAALAQTMRLRFIKA